MAPDVSADNQMLGHDRVEDHDSDERGDLTRRASRLEKGKSVKQSAGIQPDEEVVTHKHFKDLAHAILRAVESQVPEAATSLVTQDVTPPHGEKQIIPRPEIPEGSRLKHGPSDTRTKFQAAGSREEHSTASCYSRSSQGTKRKQKVHEDLRHKLNAKKASQTTEATSGAPEVPREFLEKMESLEAEVKFLSEKQSPTNALMPAAYNSSFTMEIRIAILP